MGGEDSLEQSKPYKRLKQSITLSNLWIYILSITEKEKEVYAYSLGEKILQYFDFKPSRLWIYLVLYKLENEGFLKSIEKDNRKYYMLTEKGRGLLQKGKKFLFEIYKKL